MNLIHLRLPVLAQDSCWYLEFGNNFQGLDPASETKGLLADCRSMVAAVLHDGNELMSWGVEGLRLNLRCTVFSISQK